MEPTGVAKFREKAQATRSVEDDAEQELWKGGFSPKAMLIYWLAAVVVTIGGIAASLLLKDYPVVWVVAGGLIAAVWLASFLYLLYERLSVEYQLTSQRLFHRRGILTRVTNRVEVIDIDDVQFTQNIIDRMLGVGTIRVLSSDISDPKLVMIGIDDVKRIADLIDGVRREERRRRGLHIEAV